MDRRQRRDLGVAIVGTTTAVSFLRGSASVTPYAALSVLGGLSLLAIGGMQLFRPERFTTDRTPSRRRQVAVFGLAIASFVGGWLYAVA